MKVPDVPRFARYRDVPSVLDEIDHRSLRSMSTTATGCSRGYAGEEASRAMHREDRPDRIGLCIRATTRLQ